MRKCVALLALLAGFCFAQEENVIAEGFGQGVNRQEALMAAKRNAVEKGIGMILLSQTEVENFQLKRDQIITKTIGAVKDYVIISETKSPDNLFEIQIKATLSRSTMHKDLASFHILIESMNKPRVMVVIDENNVGNDEPTNKAAETALIGFLRDPYEFELVDPEVVASIRSSKEKMVSLSGDAKAAAALGSRYGAEVVIMGNAVGRKAEGMSKSLGGMVSVQADVTLKAINCATGRIIGTAGGHAAKVHISPNTAGTQAIAKATEKAGNKLLDVIMKEWQNQLNNGIPLTIDIKEVASFRDRKAVLSTLQAITGITAVRERNWDSQSKVLSINVQYKGNANGFCERVDGYKMSSGGGSLAVTGLNGMQVTLALQVM
ncbi:MAG: hypothetical protein GF401_05680 [Chitinivibrionales bacterium]|nr:hypothetical protein [Chitinivibrionales bacterium]